MEGGDTARILASLQARGPRTAAQLVRDTGVDNRRVYEAMNSLAAVGLVRKRGGRGGAYCVGDGAARDDAVDIATFLYRVEHLQRRVVCALKRALSGE